MRVSVFAPFGALDHQTGILNAIRAYSLGGLEVDVYAVRNLRHPEPKIDSPNVRFRYMPWVFASEREPAAFVTVLFSLWILVCVWRRHAIIHSGGGRGLIAAYAYSIFRRTKIINYQMELYVGGRLQGAGTRIFQWIERRAVRQCELTIEHSEDRKAFLAQYLQVPPEKIAVVPNSPMGPARPQPSRFLHDLLGIPPDTQLLVYAGTLSEEYLLSGLVEAAAELPEGWAFVLHSAGPRSAGDDYVQHLKKLVGGSRVYFSLEPVPYRRIDEVMGSARLGIALYTQEGGPNWSSIGLASGKLSHFLKVGVPVIVSNSSGLADFVESTGAGEVILDLRSLGQTIARIQSKWQDYSQRSLSAFDRHLAYEMNFAPVLERCRAWATTQSRNE